MFLSACALPPQEAWHRIQEDGLLPYLAGGWKEAQVPINKHLDNTPPSSLPTLDANRPAPTPVLVNTGAPRQTPAPITPSPLASVGQESGKVLSAQSVPSLPGFVRSPYTNPPRLVDVKGSTPGTTMICPYTQRPFIIPSDYQNPIGTAIASAPSVKQTPDVAQNTVKQQPFVTPTIAPNNKAQPKSEPKVVTNAPAVQEIPLGVAIPGRPGFVNSPFAEKHQLVDVTGLPAGMEVKCPYTGKLFRVPAQDMVSSKPSEQPATQTLASPATDKK